MCIRDSLPKAYTDLQRNSFKSFADMSFGYYDKEVKAWFFKTAIATRCFRFPLPVETFTSPYKRLFDDSLNGAALSWRCLLYTALLKKNPPSYNAFRGGSYSLIISAVVLALLVVANVFACLLYTSRCV